MLPPPLTLHYFFSDKDRGPRIVQRLQQALLWAEPEVNFRTPIVEQRYWHLKGSSPSAFRAETDREGLHALIVIGDWHVAQALAGSADAFPEAVRQFIEQSRTDDRRKLFYIEAYAESAGLPDCVRGEQAVGWDPVLIADADKDEGKPASPSEIRILHPLITSMLAMIERADEGASSQPPFRVFISHAKRDGEPLADEVRRVLDRFAIPRFFDASDIQASDDWEAALQDAASGSAILVALQTDAYWSRSWCQREVLAAKSADAAMLVGIRLQHGEVRTFPYGGNVRTFVLPSPESDSQTPSLQSAATAITAAAMREMLAVTCWQAMLAANHSELKRQLQRKLGTDRYRRMPRPPELVRMVSELMKVESAAADDDEALTVWLYPDPPLPRYERALVVAASPPNHRFLTLGEVL